MPFEMCIFQLLHELACRDSAHAGIGSGCQRGAREIFLSITSEGTKLCVYLLSSKLGLKMQSPFSGTRPELPWSSLSSTAKQTNKEKPRAVSRYSALEIGCGYYRGVSICSTYWCLFLNEDSNILRLPGRDAQKT